MSKVDGIINSLEPFVNGLGKAVLRELREAIAQPAQESEPELCDPSFGTYDLASMILSDCGHSSNNQRLLDRVAARIDKRLAAVIAASTQPLTISEDEAWNLARYVYGRSNPHDSPQILLSAIELKGIIEAAHNIKGVTE